MWIKGWAVLLISFSAPLFYLRAYLGHADFTVLWLLERNKSLEVWWLWGSILQLKHFPPGSLRQPVLLLHYLATAGIDWQVTYIPHSVGVQQATEMLCWSASLQRSWACAATCQLAPHKEGGWSWEWCGMAPCLCSRLDRPELSWAGLWGEASM